MLFALLFHGDDTAISSVLDNEPESLMKRHVAFNTGVVQQRSRLIASHALRPARFGVTVTPGVDGPTVRAAESGGNVVNGFYLINCKDLAEAVGIAEQYPMPQGLGWIEVRPAVQEWKTAPVVDTTVSNRTIWDTYTDIDSWPTWMPTVARAEHDSGFVEGAGGRLLQHDGATQAFRLRSVAPGRSFSLELPVHEGISVTVNHFTVELPGGGTRIIHEPQVPHSALEVFGIRYTGSVNDRVTDELHALARIVADRGVPA